MRRQEVKNLQEQFGHLFTSNPQPQPSTPTKNDPSYPQAFNLVTFHQMPYIETESDEDFLDKVDQVLSDQNSGQHSRRQVILNFKVNQLTAVCKNLKMTNARLAERIKQLQQQRPSEGNLESSISFDANRSDLTMIQQDFIELQGQLSNYKAQLSNYQQKMSQQLAHKQKQIEELRFEAADAHNLRINIQQLDSQLAEKDRIISLLERRNEQLLLELEDRENQNEWTVGYRKQDYFNQKISSEMESMIDKLVKELRFEKKATARQLNEIKRLNGEVLELEEIVKAKNKKIYELELDLINANKQQALMSAKQAPLPGRNKQYRERSPLQKDQSGSQDNYHLNDGKAYFTQKNGYYFPQKHNDQKTNLNNRSQNSRSYNAVRMSAERQVPAASGAFVPAQSREGGVRSAPKTLSFTLMDLLNKEFKIRQSQKEIIACKIVDLYSRKIMQQNYENLIPEQLEVYNFNPHRVEDIRVRVNLLMNKQENDENSEEKLLYNMAFILDSLLTQVEVVDAYIQSPLELNIVDCVSQLEGKPSKEEKYKFLQELASHIQAYSLTR